MPKIYLDTSAINRVFDDQAQARVYLESTSMELLFLLIENERLEIVSSEALIFEKDRNPYSDRRAFVEAVLQKAIAYQALTADIVTRAQEIESTNRIKGLDALHLACAEALAVDAFISCDDRILKRYDGSVSAKNPTEFVSALI